MKPVLNTNNYFGNKARLTNNVSTFNKHFLKDEKVIFKATYKNLPYYDHFETTNNYSSLIYSYGADKNKNLYEHYHMVFPTFRRKNNNTHGSFNVSFDRPLVIKVDEKKAYEKLHKVTIDNFLTISSYFNYVHIDRVSYCASEYPGVITRISFTNTSNELKLISIKNIIEETSCENDYYDKPYHIESILMGSDERRLNKNYEFMISPNETRHIYYIIRCKYDDDTSKIRLRPEYNLTSNMFSNFDFNMNYVLETDNEILNVMNKLACKRANESIILTKNGYMHNPGGGSYYSALWTNDQIEYAAPFFAILDIEKSRLATINAFNLYEKYMYTDKPLVSSIIAEGISYWNGAGDRGDQEMYLYGITYFLLSQGDKELAQKYVNAIKWCIDFSMSKMTSYGVITSDADELENRFESGNINLATNSIFYQGLILANKLFNELEIENNYDVIAKHLKDSINNYFYIGNKPIYCVEETYKRAHVVYPLIMGIYDHVDDIINEIMDPSIYSVNGFKTIETEETYWDRITLMAIRGLFNADKSDLAYDILCKYSENRLLKDHVPYAIEAYPEGNQAHLSAESALYCRIYLEGILGFLPNSFNSFKLHLSIPSSLNEINLRSIYYGNKYLDICVCKDTQDDMYLLSIEQLGIYKKVSNHKDIIITL